MYSEQLSALSEKLLHERASDENQPLQKSLKALEKELFDIHQVFTQEREVLASLDNWPEKATLFNFEIPKLFWIAERECNKDEMKNNSMKIALFFISSL